MQPFRYHVIVCTQPKAENVTCCAAGGRAVVAALQGELGKQGVANEVIVSQVGCLGACEQGPVMVVYPDAVWYGKLTAADVPEIVTSHLKSGTPVERLTIKDLAKLRDDMLEHRKQFVAMMAGREKAGVLPDDLNDLVRAFMPCRTVLTALELDVFTIVGGGSTASDVVAKLGTDARATEELLNALVALGLLRKQGASYGNTEVSARFLVEGTPDSARQALLHNQTLWNEWKHLTERVRKGTASLARPMGEWSDDPKLQPAFVAYMDRNAKAGLMPFVRAVGNGFKRMLDLGGGSAAASMALARANPELQVDVLEQPSMVSLTEEYIRKAGMQERVHAKCGDMFKDKLGEGYDLVLLSSVAHMLSPEKNRELLRRAGTALAPKGRLVVQDFILEADKTAPKMGALASLTMLCLSKHGATYSEPEYESWLREAGCSEVKRVRLPGPVNLMIGTK